MVTEFVKKHFLWPTRPVSAKKEGSTWVVKVDIGVFLSGVGEVNLDAQTGAIEEYKFPS